MNIHADVAMMLVRAWTPANRSLLILKQCKIYWEVYNHWQRRNHTGTSGYESSPACLFLYTAVYAT
jgi:hypothetical protein